ncbi:amidase family protein, partial [Methylocapsa sp. S129]|uniref:amidase family protein n=1 Tax=Methylocapsa sp. S129 TaxID=1641869 RepID=UPI00352A8519
MGAQELIVSSDVRNIFETLVALEDTDSRAKYELARRSSLPALQRAYAEAFMAQRVDAIVYPVCPIRAPLIGEDNAVQLNGRPVPTFPTLIRNTDPPSAAGLPGLAVPIGFDSNSVPVGLAVDKLPGQDRELLSLGLLLE